ncbi:glycosyltransferase family 4 protein [Saccharopolyspora erythraea]|uniref:glycosyltransferase family 4 protein n=1 Tax=Saccharopolyspora erythraea TaxID=1836 RepID=UPI001BACCA53|nr:glycosyltransferase family 1 protein [Saccharopolyspora erythraea]QUH04868.1 glycosyltransferase family 4 protein [Saccharopolyspora erythraea]
MPELVAIAEQLLAPVPGGTGRYTRELLRAMAATAPPGWRLTSVVSRGGDPGAAVVDGVEGPRVLRLPRRALVAAWERGAPLWPGGDSVHAMTPLAPPPRRGRRLVVTVHDTVPWTHPETLTPRGVAWHRRAIARAGRTADAIVVPTTAVATELAQHVDLRAEVHVIGEGVTPSVIADHSNCSDANPTEPHPDNERIAARLELPPSYVLAVGTIEPRKGHADLIRALSLPGAPDVPLLVVGRQGWGGVDLHALAAEHGLGPGRVRVLGGLADAELAVVLRRAGALAAPSLAEGFGLPLLEAMAAGVPVVHSDAPALVEVAGGAGVTVPRSAPAALAEALRAVVADPDPERIEAGRRRASACTWERAAREVWRLHTEKP